MSELRTEIEKILREVLGPRKAIAPNKSLVEDLGMDSLKMMELVAALEDNFDVAIPISRLAEIKTVADLYSATSKLHDYALATDQGPI